MRILVYVAVATLISCGRISYDPQAIDGAAGPTDDAGVTLEYVTSIVVGDVDLGMADAVAVDQSDNVYLAGIFAPAVDFGSGVLTSIGSSDMFLASFTSDLSHRWSLGFGSASSDRFDGLASAGSGVAVMGEFEGTVDFGGGNLVSNGGDDLMFAAFGADGSHRWSQSFGSSGDEDTGSAVTVDDDGNSYFISAYFLSADLGGSTLTSNGLRDIVVASFDAAGAYRWSRSFGGTGIDVGDGIAVDSSGNVYLAGHFADSVDFGGGPLTSAGGSDVFVASLDSTGAHRWSKRFGGPSDDSAETAGMDSTGNLFVAGGVQGTVDFGGGALTSSGVEDIFIASFSSDGTHRWSRLDGGAGPDQGESFAVDASGNTYLAGYFTGTADFDGATLIGPGDNDIFVASFDPLGGLRWAQGFGGVGDDKGRSVAVTSTGSVLLAGYFSDTVDFGSGPVVSAGSRDTFLILLNQVSR